MPHKAKAKVSKIGTIGEVGCCDEPKGACDFRLVAQLPHPQLQDVVWRSHAHCHGSCSCGVVVGRS